MKRAIFTIFSLLLTFGTLSADDLKPFANLKGTLNIAGGTAHIASEKEAIKDIMRKYPDISITIAGGGTGVGIKQVSEGLVDIANAGRAPTENELKSGDLKSHLFALDGIVIIVNKNLNISNLTTQNLIDIFTGKTTSFSDFGASGGKINLYIRDASSATMEVFSKQGINGAKISKDAKVVPSNAAMKTAIFSDKNGIGFVSFGTVDKSVKTLCIDDRCPSKEAILNDEYHIYRGLYAVTKNSPKPLALEFINYLKSDSGAKILTSQGLIPYQK